MSCAEKTELVSLDAEGPQFLASIGHLLLEGVNCKLGWILGDETSSQEVH